MTLKEVELPSVDSSKECTSTVSKETLKVEISEDKLKRVPWKTLFITYASGKERCQLVFGLISSFMTGFLIPISYIFLGSIVNQNNQESVQLDQIIQTLLLFIGNLIVATFFAYCERLCLNGFAENLTRHFREDYIRSLMKHDAEYVESIKPGILGQRFSEESSRIINGLGPSIGQLVRAVATFIAGGILGFMHSWELTILTLIAFPFVTWTGFRYAKVMGEWAETLMKDHQTADGIADESFRNVKTVAALGAEKKFEKKYIGIIDKCRYVLLRALYRAGSWLGTMSLSNNIAISLVFLFTTFLIRYQRVSFPQTLADNNCIPAGSTSVDVCFNITGNLSTVCTSLCEEVKKCWYESRNGQCLVGGDLLIVLCGVMNSFLGVGTAFTAIQAIEKTRMSTACFVNVIEHVDELDATGKTGTEPQSNGGDIEFKDVHFRYKGRDVMILNGLNLSIREGEMIGLVGESGCGKSTVLKLLMRLYAPSSGHIEWNGADVSGLSIPWVRDQISYVSQEPVLFSGTIRENIMYGRVGCTEAEMIDAAKLVEADAFIRTFPKGYDTFVGELGTSLSGGQKQRIAIARAFLRKPRILVFDEATSALDTQSERIVQRAIENIRSTSTANGGRLSIVVVAHRLSSIRSCDRIVVIDEGRVAEEGTHESLLSKGGIYSVLYQSQENVSTPTPTPSEKIMEEMTAEKTTEKVDVNMSAKTVSDMEEKSDKKYSLFSVYRYFGKYKTLFWISLLGNLLCATYPPAYGVVVAFMHSIPFLPDIADIYSTGMMLTCLMAVIAIVYFIGTLLWWDLSSVVKEDMIVTVRSKAYSKLLSLPPSYYDEGQHAPTSITSELSVDVRKLRDFLDEVGAICECIFLLVTGLCISFSSIGSWLLSIIALIGAPLLLTAEYCQNKLLADVIGEIDSNLTKKSGELTDYMLNIHTIHAYNLASTITNKIICDLKKTDKLCRSRTRRAAVANIMAILFPMTYMIILFGVGSVFISYNLITFSQMFIVYNCIFLMATYAGVTLGKVPNMRLAQAAASRIFSLLDTPSESEKERAVVTTGRDGDIMFDHVSFAYPTRPEAKILNDISFTIPAGSSVAFVGPSGCGKSTIISLIQRMYHCGSGSISLDGTDINSLNLDWYRAQLGAVNQEPCLFSGTIRDNILMGVNGDVSTEVIEEVCRQALCLDFINEMPDRFETDLGTTGKAVSGGQKQRLALARAILREPRVLLLDEATSALDSENQEKFLQALKIWRENRRCTVVTVAHRLSTIVDSDVIFVVNNGNIVGKGTHQKLLNSCPFYTELVRGQMNSSVI